MSTLSKPLRLRRGPKRITSVGAAERRAGYAVLCVLLAVLAYALTKQSQFNPAVVAALREGPADAKKTSGQPASELTPALDALPGVAALAGAETFGPDTLSDKIDGKAELYLSSGFKEMVWRPLAPAGGDKARFDVYVYDMASPDSAFAVFSGQRRSGAAASGLTENAYSTGNALFFTVGARYLEIVADSDEAAVKNLLEPLGAALLAKLSPSPGEGAGRETQSSPASLFPAQGMTPGSLRLAMADAFGLEGFGNVYTADYALGGAEATGFAAILPDEAQARTWKQNYLAFLLANGYGEITAQDLPEGAQALESNGVFEVLLKQGRLFYGIHEATSLQAAVALAATFEKQAREKMR
ncbi:MAG: hypothetical protein HQK81_00650 [Desulfovibrionaceae bacterium]|nr:hypothetical protein [Desulfovibrionaceae bacterium]MBF0512556.1 hypothetical protein [Desulfovibrionaceae bacterium]